MAKSIVETVYLKSIVEIDLSVYLETKETDCKKVEVYTDGEIDCRNRLPEIDCRNLFECVPGNQRNRLQKAHKCGKRKIKKMGRVPCIRSF